MYGQPMRADAANPDDALRGPRRSASTHAEYLPQSHVVGVHYGTYHGIYPLALSSVAVGISFPAGAAAYLNATQIDGYVPGMRVAPVTGGAWSVVFSYGSCETQRRDGISRLLAGIPLPVEGPNFDLD